MDNIENKNKIVNVTRYDELEQAKKDVVKAKVHTGICALALVIGILGKVNIPLMSLMGVVTGIRISKLFDAIKKKTGLEKAIPLEEARLRELQDNENDNNEEVGKTR